MKSIIFDLDGVVVDTERYVWYFSSVELLKLYGIVHDEKSVRPFMLGTHFEDGTRLLYDFYNIDDSFESFLEKRRKLVRRGFAENVIFMEGFDEFYKRLGKRKKAIATSMNDDFLKLTLNHLPLTKYFGVHIYPISQVGHVAKPHPDIFLHAAAQIGEDPANCIVIEDAPKGVTAANAAGMRSIALATSVQRDLLSDASHVVDSFAEITEEMLS